MTALRDPTHSNKNRVGHFVCKNKEFCINLNGIFECDTKYKMQEHRRLCSNIYYRQCDEHNVQFNTIYMFRKHRNEFHGETYVLDSRRKT